MTGLLGRCTGLIWREDATGSACDSGDSLARMPEDLLSIDDIADLLELSRRTVARYLVNEELGFPAPAATVGRVRVWRRREVERWAKKTLPLPEGRPPKD